MNILQEKQIILEQGKLKALKKLIDYKLVTLKNMLKNGNISKYEYLKKSDYLKSQLANIIYKVEPLIDPTIATTIQRVSHFMS